MKEVRQRRPRFGLSSRPLLSPPELGSCFSPSAEPDPRTQIECRPKSAKGVVSPCDRSPSRLGYELPLQHRRRLLGAVTKPQSALVVMGGGGGGGGGCRKGKSCCGFAWFASQDPAIDRRPGLSGVDAWFLYDRLPQSSRRQWPTLGVAVIRLENKPVGAEAEEETPRGELLQHARSSTSYVLLYVLQYESTSRN